MNAEESKHQALRALEFMRTNRAEPNICFGYAWGTLARIAGNPELYWEEKRPTADKAEDRS